MIETKKPKESKDKELPKIKAKVNNKKKAFLINKTKNWYVEKTQNMDKPSNLLTHVTWHK